MHYLSKSCRSDWKVSRKDYLGRKRASGRRSARHMHRAERQGGRQRTAHRPIAARAKSVRRQVGRGLGRISLREVLTVLILLESVLWVFYGIFCRVRQAAGPAAVEAGVWISGVILAAVFALCCSRTDMQRIHRRRHLLYLEYAVIALAVVVQIWRGPEPVRAASLLPALVLGIDRISAFLG